MSHTSKVITEEQALIRSVIADIHSDAPRLVYADWLDENGQSARAEFIRLQIELHNSDAPTIAEIKGGDFQKGAEEKRLRERSLWCHPDVPKWFGESLQITYSPIMFSQPINLSSGLVSRGFVDEIRCTLSAFVDQRCDHCAGTGMPHFHSKHSMQCSFCHGTGTLPGLARTLFGTHPITRVTLTDREPLDQRTIQEWSWGCQLDFDGPSQLPEKIWNCLVGQRRGNSSYIVAEAVYPTREAALAALSDACVRYARSLHGFDPLQPAIN